MSPGKSTVSLFTSCRLMRKKKHGRGTNIVQFTNNGKKKLQKCSTRGGMAEYSFVITQDLFLFMDFTCLAINRFLEGSIKMP